MDPYEYMHLLQRLGPHCFFRGIRLYCTWVLPTTTTMYATWAPPRYSHACPLFRNNAQVLFLSCALQNSRPDFPSTFNIYPTDIWHINAAFGLPPPFSDIHLVCLPILAVFMSHHTPITPWTYLPTDTIINAPSAPQIINAPSTPQTNTSARSQTSEVDLGFIFYSSLIWTYTWITHHHFQHWRRSWAEHGPISRLKIELWIAAGPGDCQREGNGGGWRKGGRHGKCSGHDGHRTQWVWWVWWTSRCRGCSECGWWLDAADLVDAAEMADILGTAEQSKRACGYGKGL